ncbi:hypothetical protein BPOR_0686g00030 [Botrytis porri]|uniref:Uncharacterized protein n=1 Tax=Botrytis porri TaxID=87229 RepID=A0A4Z1KAW7_9HELO|nr:hypothetical protein BPOR_0686g00030 [Botrytis porri]
MKNIAIANPCSRQEFRFPRHRPTVQSQTMEVSFPISTIDCTDTPQTRGTFDRPLKGNKVTSDETYES